MTSRSKNAVRGYETEIEKSREESNWKKAVELAQQLKARSPQHESLAHFLIGEGKLEAHLEEWPPSKENIERAQRELSEARGYLTLATDEAGKRAGVALDAHLLLGKLNYACGAYDDALKNYKLAELNTLTEKELPVRSLRIVAESYAIKGLCLELNTVPGSTSRYKQAERENEMIRSFELSSDLTLLYLQRTGANAHAGPTLETALQRVPILHIRAGRLQNAIDRYREMLNAVESTSTQALRLTLTRQLAEVLMRGVTGQVYKAPEKLAVVPATGTLSRRRDDHVADGPWKPKRYAAINQFVPRNEYEEVVLLLLVGEAMAVRDAVLSQSAELVAASTCYRMGWIEEGIEMSEEALAIEDAHGGRMLARCCLYAGQGYQMKAQKTNARIDKEAANDTSLKLLLRAVSLDDNDHLAFYYLALQYMHLGMLNEAMEALATGKELLSLVNSSESELEPEHNGYAELDAMSDSVHDDTQSNRDAGRVSAAAGCVSEAATLTPFSHLVLYTRGLVHAASSEWDEARQCFQNALAIHPTHLDSMVQLVLWPLLIYVIILKLMHSLFISQSNVVFYNLSWRNGIKSYKSLRLGPGNVASARVGDSFQTTPSFKSDSYVSVSCISIPS
ncbi:hypothetical protein B5X24_HaOG204856 [Helicoverpa armigera]|uniref:Tetratricopeptide repeat protein 7 N-terminal domain-containing protein n=1 Tax=Helicoverpa armigera TaxID=29058 RepID=A0A2W1BTZ7_HELAM|nr:hypothetical protein B5X24_HaOG204856 [Helicoverpa armigera]